MQTRSIGQANVDVWVAPHGLHCHRLYTGTCRLLGCNCLLEVWQWDGANLHQFPYSNCMTFFQPWCKPVVLDKQCWWYLGCVLMFGLHPHGLHSLSLYTVRLFGCNCLPEVWQWDGANCETAFIPIFQLHDFCPTFVQTSDIGQTIVHMYQFTVCVRVTRIVLCVASCAHTRKCTRVGGWVASKGVLFQKIHLLYIGRLSQLFI